MATSMIDRYKKILEADPSSMVFVELAKALLDKGRLDEAIECCKQGLGHHPESIVGHVLWGRSLIDQGLPDEAMDQFEEAIAIDRDNPYAYNLIGEALLHRRLYRSALPVLERAVSLQPGDRRVKQWLTQAQKAVGEASGEGEAATALVDPTVTDGASTAFDSAFDKIGAVSPHVATGNTDTTEVAVGTLDTATGDHRGAPWEQAADGDETQIVSALQPEAAEDAAGWPAMPPAEPSEQGWPGMPESEPAEQAPTHQEWPGMPPAEPAEEGLDWPGMPDSQPEEASWPESHDELGSSETDESAEAEDSVMSGMTATFQALEDAGTFDDSPWGEAPVPEQADQSVDDPPERSPRPPPLPPPLPSARRGASVPQKPQVEEVFGLELPPLPGRVATPLPDEAPAADEQEDPGATQAIAQEYERELREEMIVSKQKTRSKGKTIMMAMGGLTLLVAVTAGVAFVWGTISGREEAIATGLEQARNGIARDTYAGYVAALDRLAEVLKMSPENTTARAMVAAAEAVVFAELDPDPERKERAETLLADPELAAALPDTVLDARYHLADEEGRAAIAQEIEKALEARDKSVTLNYLAGRHALVSGETEKATSHFSKVLDLQPGHARTVLALAGHEAGLGRWEQALTYYDNARTNFPGHGRAEIGAAEARLALGREQTEALTSILELEREHKEVLSKQEFLSLQLVAAKLQHATGSSEAALVRLRAAHETYPQAAAIPLLMAEIQASSFDLVSALGAAEQAVDLAPDDVEAKRLKAHVLTSWSRYAEASSVLESIDEPDRRVWLERAIVAYHAGDRRAARRALDNTRNEEGQMSSDAAIYLALVDMTNDARSALTVLNRAARARGADALIEWALGRFHLEQGNERPARTHLGRAIEEDPRSFRAHTDLGLLEFKGGAHDRALANFTAAIEINPHFREALQMLGESHLLLGEAEPSRDAFRRVLAHHAEDSAAHRGLALALLDLEEIEGAERHARTAVEHGRQEAGSHHALGRVLLAKGEAAEAIPSLVQARRRDPEDAAILTNLALAHLERGRGPDRRQARRYLEQALEQDSGHAVAHWHLGRILLDERDIRASLQSLNRAVNLLRRAGDDRKLAQAMIDLSKAHAAGGGRRGLDRARRTAVEGVRARDTAEGREQLAMVYIEEGRPVLARQHLEQAVELDPNRAMAHLELGKILAEAGEKESARAALERALELAPQGRHVREARRLLASLAD